jgi:hypothetical protein
MGPKAKKVRLAILNREVHSIHGANRLFWERQNAHTHEADIEYYRRQDRLEAIRRKLVVLTH